MRYLIVMLSLILIAGCGTISPRERWDETITHAGTHDDLSRGLYAGTLAVSNLVQYGDYGIGTFHALDGYLIAASGVVYRADAGFKVAPAAADALVPFAVVTYFTADRMFDVEKMNERLFKRALELKRRQNRLPEAVQVSGRFSTITLGSIAVQPEPWRPLAQAEKANRQETILTNVTGTMIGYYYPAGISSLLPPGYSFHFLSDDLTTGGAVQTFSISQARIIIDTSPFLQVLMPQEADVDPMAKPIVPPAAAARQ